MSEGTVSRLELSSIAIYCIRGFTHALTDWLHMRMSMATEGAGVVRRFIGRSIAGETDG